jgi:hypothetical protein
MLCQWAHRSRRVNIKPLIANKPAVSFGGRFLTFTPAAVLVLPHSLPSGPARVRVSTAVATARAAHGSPAPGRTFCVPGGHNRGNGTGCARIARASNQSQPRRKSRKHRCRPVTPNKRRRTGRSVTVPAPPPSVPEPPAPTPSPAPEPAPTDKPPHPWKRAWSKRRQRELAGAT